MVDWLRKRLHSDRCCNFRILDTSAYSPISRATHLTASHSNSIDHSCVLSVNLAINYVPRRDSYLQHPSRHLRSLRPLHFYATFSAAAWWRELANRAPWIQETNKAAMAFWSNSPSTDRQNFLSASKARSVIVRNDQTHHGNYGYHSG